MICCVRENRVGLRSRLQGAGGSAGDVAPVSQQYIVFDTARKLSSRGKSRRQVGGPRRQCGDDIVRIVRTGQVTHAQVSAPLLFSLSVLAVVSAGTYRFCLAVAFGVDEAALVF